MKRTPLLVASTLLLLAVLAAAWRVGQQPRPVELVPSLTGQPEYCLTCHGDLPAISPSHPVQSFGCVLCHGGERLALEAGLAHSTLRGGRNPSDLSVVSQSCGGAACHSGDPALERDHIDRLRSSLHATYAGAIAGVRYQFGAQPDLIPRLGVIAVQDLAGYTPTGIQRLDAFDPELETSASIQSFAQQCLNCHISSLPPAGPEFARLAGCAACHTPTAVAGVPQERESGAVHRLTAAVPSTQCNTCHNRGQYDLKGLTFQPGAGAQDHPISHDKVELDCVDCHTRQEMMGNGHLYPNQNEAQVVRCRTCHGTHSQKPRTLTLANPEELSFRMAFLNPAIDLAVGDTVILSEKGEPLWNIRRLEDGTFELRAKLSGKRYAIPQVKDSACQQQPEEQEAQACYECHPGNTP